MEKVIANLLQCKSVAITVRNMFAMSQKMEDISSYYKKIKHKSSYYTQTISWKTNKNKWIIVTYVDLIYYDIIIWE